MFDRNIGVYIAKKSTRSKMAQHVKKRAYLFLKKSLLIKKKPFL